MTGLAVPLDDETARIGLVDGHDPPGAPGDPDCFLRNPGRGRSTMPVADDQFGLAVPRGHGVAVEEQRLPTRNRQPVQSLFNFSMKGGMGLANPRAQIRGRDLLY